MNNQNDTTTFTMRLPKDLKKAFEQATKAADTTGAQVIRQWIRQYVEYHMKTAQGDLLDNSKKRR